MANQSTKFASGRSSKDSQSIGEFDQTHALKLSTVYELPLGKGKRFHSSNAVANAVLGGWRRGGIVTYVSGFPVALTRNNPPPFSIATHGPRSARI